MGFAPSFSYYTANVNGKRRNTFRGRPSFEEILGRLDEEVTLLHERLGGLPRAVEADEVLRSIWIDDVHNSTAIEGNTMTRAQVAELIDHRRASASLVESLEVEGYARAADWVYRTAPQDEGVAASTVAEIHAMTVELAWKVEPPATRDRPGAWRTSPVRFRTNDGVVPAAIPAELDSWSESSRHMVEHPIVHAAVHHAWFERIHPFVDGNGRVGRLILNLLLLQNGYPPAVIQVERCRQYLQALERADRENPRSLAEVIARATSATLTQILMPRLAGDAKLVPLATLAADGPYGAAYLRQLAIAGRLRAVREGRLWLSSRVWLDEYVSQRDPRGRPLGERN